METIPMHLMSTESSLHNFSDCNTSAVCGDEDFYGPEEEFQWTSSKIKKIVLLSIVMALSIIGNSLIIIILTCSKTHKRLSRVNMFILNLAIGDLSVIWTIGSEIIFEVYGEWKLGNLGCKLIMYIQIVTLSSTTYILCVMSFSRFQAICRPLDFTPSPRKMIFAAWISAFICALPYLFIYVQVQKGEHMECLSEGYTASWQKRVNFIWLTCSVLIIPAIFISFCYFSLAKVVWQQGESQQMTSKDGTVLRKHCDIRVIPRAKIKTLKMSLTIVISFLLCWSPYFIVYNILIFSDYQVEIPEIIMVLVETLALLNSVMNPMIYGCFNLRIRQGLREACYCFKSVHSEYVCLTKSPECFKIANKSRLSEPSGSTTSTIRIKNVRWTPDCQRRYPRHFSDGKCTFNFAQSTKHIQKKRSKTLQRTQTSSATDSHHSTLIHISNYKVSNKFSPQHV